MIDIPGTHGQAVAESPRGPYGCGLPSAKYSVLKFIGYKRILLLCLGMCFTLTASAEVENIGQMATWITGSFGTLAKLITAVAYLLGLLFSLGAVFKMRQHRDNPTQIPIGTPFILLFIASAMLFFSNTLKITAKGVFGTTQSQGASGTGRY